MDQAMPIDFGSCLVFWVETIPWSDSIGKHVLRSWCFLCRSVVLFKSSQKHVARGNLRSNDKTLWASMGTVAGHLLSTSLSIQLFLTHTVWYQVMLHHFGYAWGILTSKRSWTNTLSATQQKKQPMNSVRVCHTCSRRFSFYAIKLALVRKMRVVRRPQHKGRECDAREILWHGDLCMSRI